MVKIHTDKNVADLLTKAFDLYLILLGKAKKSVRLMMEKLFGMELELILFWSTVKAKTINEEEQLHALVDGRKIIITESSVRRDFQLVGEEGSANPTDSHHTPTFIQPSSQPQKTQKPRKPKRKDTQVPQPSDPTKSVADEAVHKELGDSLVRTATTASSLEAEQDSDGGPGCQETMGDTTARTRFESVSKHSNDSLLARGNTLQSDEDRLKLDELMELCTTLQQRVLDLEKTKTTQQNEIDTLKRRVKKLEKKRSSRTHKLKRLYKVGLTVRVESSDDEESLGEDASKQGRINVIDADDDITLVSFHDEMEVDEEVVEVINTASATTTVSTGTTTTTTTVDGITLAQALEEMKNTKPKQKGDKGKGIMIEPMKHMKKKDQISFDEETAKRMQAQEQEELSIEEKATLFQQLLEKRRKHFAAKRVEERRNKLPTEAQQRKIMCTYLKNMKGYKLKDLKLKKQKKKAGAELVQENIKKQKVEDDKETTEIKKLMEIIPDEEEVAIDAIPLAVKSPSIVGWKIHKEGRKS
ncbi:hypothetical protein Tco_0646066 [Tanacetum coccineum]